MTPIIWVCGIVTPSCIGGACYLQDNWLLSSILVCVGAFPVLVAIGMFVYFGIKDPDRLHSEWYRLGERVIAVAESKGGTVPLNPIDLQAIPNPYPRHPALTDKSSAAVPMLPDEEKANAD